MKKISAFESDQGIPYKTQRGAVAADLFDAMAELADVGRNNNVKITSVAADYMVDNPEKIIRILTQMTDKRAG